MIRLITRSTLIAVLSVYAGSIAVCQEINFESKYLSTAVAGFHGYQIKGTLVGKAMLTLNPNQCMLDLYGDRTLCTLIAPTVAEVTLAELKILDPTGQGRHVYAVDNHGLPGGLNLVTTSKADDGWFVFTQRNGHRIVIDLDPSSSSASKRIGTPTACAPLSATVDGTAANYKVVAGFVTNSWILLLKGKKPHGATRVDFQPVTYVQQPEFWQINVAECSDGISIPVVTTYDVAFDITPYLGKKGIELVFGDKKVQIKVPPTHK